MSTSIALTLIIATFFLGFFCYYYISKMTNDVFDETVTGILRGIPLPTKYRGLRFYLFFVSYVTGALICAIFFALVNLRIAQHVADEDIKGLAYWAVAVGSIAAVGWVVMGVSSWMYVRSLLRQTTGD